VVAFVVVIVAVNCLHFLPSLVLWDYPDFLCTPLRDPARSFCDAPPKLFSVAEGVLCMLRRVSFAQ